MSTDVNQKVKIVNDLLQAGEPGNVTKPDTNGYVGYEPQAIIDAMNEGFGIGNWGFEEISSETVDNEKGTLAVAQICVWLKDIEFRPFAWGQSRVTRGDTGDARKGAQTDAIKKALAYFSIGNRAYHGLLDGKKPVSHAKSASQPVPAAQPALNEHYLAVARQLEAYKSAFPEQCKDAKWKYAVLRGALDLQNGEPLPAVSAYTADDAHRVELYVTSATHKKAS